MAKKTKWEAQYGEAKPGGDECQDCRWFQRPTGCDITEGRISPTGWCKYYHSRNGVKRRYPFGIRSDREYVSRMRASGS